MAMTTPIASATDELELAQDRIVVRQVRVDDDGVFPPEEVLCLRIIAVVHPPHCTKHPDPLSPGLQQYQAVVRKRGRSDPLRWVRLEDFKRLGIKP